MATIKFLNGKGKYQDDTAIQDVVRYICYPSKTLSHIIGGAHIDLNDIAQSMIDVSEFYKKNSRTRLIHFVLCFRPEDLYLPNMASMIGDEISNFIGQEYQVVYALHEDTICPHIHFVFNAISHVDGHRYRGQHHDRDNILYCIQSILSSYGIGRLIPVKYIPKPAENPNE